MKRKFVERSVYILIDLVIGFGPPGMGSTTTVEKRV